ncbi:MAG TPA: 2-oxoglutarate dehydrogenase complex dihydrolipoyllysine-residue succinyltransferase [Acidobacteriota bacterium]
MKLEIKVPSVGESVSEVRIARWFKNSGETVQMDEPLLELETDKANMEMAAEQSGRLTIQAKEGATVAPGDVIGFVETDGAKQGAAAQSSKTESGGASKEAAVPAATPTPRHEVDESAPPPRSGPAVRRLAREHDVDPGAVPGTGKSGRVSKDDVLNAIGSEKTETAAAPARPIAVPMQPKTSSSPVPKQMPAARSGERERVVPMSLLRQKIAERLVQAQQTAAILTTFNEADMSAVMGLRARYKESFQQKYGIGLGLMSFFVKASIEALQAVPALNAVIEGKNLVYREYYDIGVAVATDRGLVVPVMRDADKLNFAEIENKVAEFARKAREGSITVDELTGGTFTITNGGVFGSLFSTPILNMPQSGILGMHTIQKRPVVINDQIAIRPMMYLALSYDHRIVDGKEAVTFLKRIKDCIEDPNRLVLGI